MHPALRRALEPVVRDIAATGAAMPTVEDREWEDSPGTASAFLRDDLGGTTGLCIDLDASDGEQVAHVAEQVQEWVVEEHWSADSNWPVCPAHPTSHPMTVEATPDAATWRCPAGGPVSVGIGSLPAAGR